MNKVFFIIVGLSLSLFSCIPVRQFEDEKSRREKCESDYNELKAKYEKIAMQNEEITNQNAILQRKINLLANDTSTLNNSLRTMKNQYDKINSLYQLLLEKNKELLEGKTEETKKISTELRLTQEQLQNKEEELKLTQEKLQRKEEELKKLEEELAKKQKYQEELSQKLNLQKLNQDSLQAVLKTKEQRIIELENILEEQKKSVNELKSKVSSALLGFENNGLTVNIKNGKVYVSMEESLLFPSGSWAVNAKGRDAIIKLAKMLENNPDVNILVEGHTDNVPFKGNGNVRDNWDLSVMRATAIVKIITENSKVDPKRLIAAGRSEYLPVEPGNDPVSRQKNRRTEIILTPKLDKLFEILEMNK